MDFLQNHIESLIFCSTDPVKVEEIKQCLNEMFEADIPEEDILAALESLLKKYEEDIYPFQILRTAGGFQFLTKPAYQSSISILLKQKSKKRLSTSSLETLAIIAYKQPITKGHIEQIRGVNCDYAIQRLLEKQLIEIQGKSEGVGKPILYGTTEKFMDYFGINSLKDLPLPKDFGTSENQIGEISDSEHPMSENEPRIQDYQNDEAINPEDSQHTINPSTESAEPDQNHTAEDQPDNE
jgi:segregation and condensation protein B